jgi:hypothetical protein
MTSEGVRGIRPSGNCGTYVTLVRSTLALWQVTLFMHFE